MARRRSGSGRAGSLPVAPEAVLLRQITRLARLRGWALYHTHRSEHSERGFPDLVLLKPPACVVAELKRAGKVPTPAQDDWLAAFRACGIPAYVWRLEDWPQIDATLT